MRALMAAAVFLVATQAFAQETSAQVSAAPNSASTSNASTATTRAQLVEAYPDRLADRPRAIGANLFEAGWDANWQFNSNQGFGEVPDVRYGVTDAFEVNLLGVRYVVAEDAAYIPGLAIRAQLHDLAYQDHAGTNFRYPFLRPGAFFELRDRFPWHLAVNAVMGYDASIQGARAADGTLLPISQRVSDSFAPFKGEIQWSPLSMLSFAVSGGYLLDTSVPAYEGATQSDALLTVAAIYNCSRFDVRVFFTNNWFADPTLGYVPELGVGAAVRL